MSGTEQRVLLAEDEEGLRLILGKHIESSGFAVDYAANGQEAIALLREREYAVVVTDMRMERADGLEVMRAAKDRWPFTQVIILTAYGSLDNVIEAVRTGNLFDYITKPFEDIRQVSVAVRRAVEHRRLQVQNLALELQLQRALERLDKGIEHLMLAGKRAGIGQLTETVAREILGPLEAVSRMSQYLSEKVQDLRVEKGEEQEKARALVGLQRLGDAARHAARVLDALLRYSSETQEPSVVSVNGLVRDTLILLESELIRSCLNLETHFSSDVPDLLVPPSKLQQVLTALLLNAIEATPPGGTVTVLTGAVPFASGTSEVERVSSAWGACIEIRDTGRGMDQATISAILDSNSPLCVWQTGGKPRLGLATSKAILEELGGRIEIRSRSGVGTRVKVILPGPAAHRLDTPEQHAA